MGHRGGSSPEGTKVRKLKTLYVRAPAYDWNALLYGRKTEFRVPDLGVGAKGLFAPTLVVLYCTTRADGLRTKLVALNEHRKERLMDIAESKPSLDREGFDSYDAFRAYWRLRTKRPYDPTQVVEVFHIGPLFSVDLGAVGRVMVERLYGDYL